MKIEVTDGKLVVTPISKDERPIIYALAAAWATFENVLYPVIGEALRCTQDDMPESGSSHRRQAKED